MDALNLDLNELKRSIQDDICGVLYEIHKSIFGEETNDEISFTADEIKTHLSITIIYDYDDNIDNFEHIYAERLPIECFCVSQFYHFYVESNDKTTSWQDIPIEQLRCILITLHKRKEVIIQLLKEKYS